MRGILHFLIYVLAKYRPRVRADGQTSVEMVRIRPSLRPYLHKLPA